MKNLSKKSQSFWTNHLGTIIFVVAVLVAALMGILWASTALGNFEWLPFR